jgi:tetratricopeptide (TPR) repeat protein
MYALNKNRCYNKAGAYGRTFGGKMRNTVFIILISLFFVNNTGIINAQDEQNIYSTIYGNLNIKPIEPSEIVSPSENEAAMMAYNIGTYYMRENRLSDSEKFLKEAIELDPAFVDAMDHLGLVYRRQNRIEEAEKIYLKSIELNDKNRVPFINLAVVYSIQGRLNDAFQLYRHLVQIFPDDPEGYYGIGEIFYMVNDYENAMPFFDKAIELYIDLNSPYVYDAFYYKGMIYYYIDKYDEALKFLEEARKVNPNNKTLENTIIEIRSKN